ncbi:MAG: hypothetical protein ABL957_06580 [Parvularculaceae bacterium]
MTTARPHLDALRHAVRTTARMTAARTRIAGAAGAGMVAALAAAEASAQGRGGDDLDAAIAAAPTASSIADILDFAEICATRPAFGAFFERHNHDFFTPRFAHERHLSGGFGGRDRPARHDEHDAGDPSRGHDAHEARSSDNGTPASEGEPSHDEAPGHADEASASELAPAHAQHELAEAHVHDLSAGLDLDAGLATLIEAAHADHAAVAGADDAPAEASAAAAPETSPPGPAAAEAHGHSALGDLIAMDGPPEPVIVTAEI